MYTIKFQQGASGTQRATFDAAVDEAMRRAAPGDPAKVYLVGAPSVRMATVWADGGIDYTPEGAQQSNAERRQVA